MKKASLLLILGILSFSCKKEAKDPQVFNSQFDNYKNNFVENLWKVYPDWATNQGFHKYDSVIKVPNADYRKEQLAFAESNLDSLKTYAIEQLSDNNVTDYYMIKNFLEGSVFSVNELKS